MEETRNTDTIENAKVFITDSEMEYETTGPGVKRKIMSYDESLMLVKVVFEKGSIGPLHQHYHTQITHIESGSFDVEIGGEHKILNGGDCFYIPPHVIHGVVCLEAGVLIDVFSPMREDFVNVAK